MPLEDSTSRAQYETNGTTGPFAVPFYFLADSHLQVIHTDSLGVETILTLTTQYSVAGAGNPMGGAVTLVSATPGVDYPAGGYVTVIRSVPVTQLTAYAAADAFPAVAHEQALDKLTMIAQQFNEQLDRALVVGAGEAGTAALPGAVARRGRMLGFDTLDSDPEATPFTMSEVAAAIEAAQLSGVTEGRFASFEAFTVSAGTTVVDLPSVTYTVGTNSLFVFANGLLLTRGTDYTETSATRITLTNALPDDTEFSVIGGRLVSSGLVSGTVGYVAPGAGAVGESLDTILNRTVRVESYMQGGDADDSVGVQRAVDYAASLIDAGDPSDNGIEIEFGNRTYDFGGSTVTVTVGGLCISGPKGRGAQITGSGLLFDVGTATDRPAGIVFQNLVLRSSSGSSTTAVGIRLYRTTQLRIRNVRFADLYIGLDMERATNTYLEDSYFVNSGRTVQALAHVRMQGTDETAFVTPATYTPGGGMHMRDCEFRGASGTVDTKSGILVKSVDGLYITQCHWTGCETSIDIDPDGSAENHTITDVMVQNSYCDEPSSFASTTRCVQIRGDVAQLITMASGATQRSTYSAISFSQCLFRGAAEADRCVYISVTDLDTWWDDYDLSDIKFVGCAIRNATITGMQLIGASAGSVEARNVVVSGCSFRNNASSSTSGYGTAITAECESIVFTGNTIGPDSGTSDYIIFIGVGDVGDDEAAPAAVVTGNDLSLATGYTSGKPIRIKPDSIGPGVSVSGNVLPGPGREYDELYKVTTTGATPTSIWTYLLPQGASGYVSAEVSGSNADGSKAVVYVFEVGFRRNSGGAELSTGTTDWHSVRAWNPDTFATPPAATLSTSTLTVDVTGIAATTIDWVVHIVMTRSH